MSAATATAAGDRLGRLDATLLARPTAMLTLAPDRPRASLPSELFATLKRSDDSNDFLIALRHGIAEVFDAILRAFPGNLFWDLDGLIGVVTAGARAQADPTSAVAQALLGVADLQDLFGKGPINFQYVHDFVYGFDWAKWVARAPRSRAAIGPFDPAFLNAMRTRGTELLDVIAADTDAKYPRLAGSESRNPFGFSREPSDEQALHRELARRDLIPVAAWSVRPDAVWDRPFAKLRGQVAAELGLSRPKE